MSDKQMQTEIEAIRAVIQSGVSGDFQDVANAVKEKYRLQVGVALVEKVYRQLQEAEHEAAQTVRELAHPAPASHGTAIDDETLRKVLRFAEEMGGFEQARCALDVAEKKLRELI